MSSAAIPPVVLGHTGPAGDHNVNPISAVPELVAATAAALRVRSELFGEPFATVDQPSSDHLEDARSSLLEYADALAARLATGGTTIVVAGRCAASMATLPRVMAHRPDAVVLWLDAHADLNLPGSATDYLGGMALSAPLGWWDSGFGAGVTPEQLVLVGTRSIDAAERDAITAAQILVVGPGDDLVDRVVDRVAGRPVYLHLDCDALEPGISRTDYTEPDGIPLARLRSLSEQLSRCSEVIGVEVAEWEGPGSSSADDLIDALLPLLDQEGTSPW